MVIKFPGKQQAQQIVSKSYFCYGADSGGNQRVPFTLPVNIMAVFQHMFGELRGMKNSALRMV